MSKMTIAEAIAEYLALHTEAMNLGTDRPELDTQIDPGLREKILRQRDRVNATLTGVAPEVHVAHLKSLNEGLRIALRRLALVPAKPIPPPMPVWDDSAKAWRIPDSGQVNVGNPSRPFDDRVDDLFLD
jgi:hypothetical protein